MAFMTIKEIEDAICKLESGIADDHRIIKEIDQLFTDLECEIKEMEV